LQACDGIRPMQISRFYRISRPSRSSVTGRVLAPPEIDYKGRPLLLLRTVFGLGPIEHAYGSLALRHRNRPVARRMSEHVRVDRMACAARPAFGFMERSERPTHIWTHGP
jgi:hypothetical protein